MRLINQTSEFEFLFLGLTDIPSAQLPLFLLFLLVYALTLMGNLLILLLIFSDSRLHTPMYFFLSNLACVDVFYSSVTSPRMLSDFFSRNKSIGLSSCLTQFFFFFSFICIELYLLAAMSYDRYIAICQPLHYIQVMHPRFCTKMVSAAWSLGFLTSSVHTLCAKRLTFCGPNIMYGFFCDLPQLFLLSCTNTCGPNIMYGFFCDLPQLFLLSCTNTFINVLVMFLVGTIMGSGALGITFVPYVHIFRTVLGIQTRKGRLKTFSTCTSHLMVVFIFYGTLIFTYLRPSPGSLVSDDRLVSIVYTVLTPLLNPIIYSLRNKDLKEAFRRTLDKIISTNKK